MDVVDLYCGCGGMSAGAIQSGCRIVAGVDCDDAVLRLWAGNTCGKACVATLWRDPVTLPPPRPNLHVALSPPCTSLSNAQRSATAEAKEEGLDAIRQSIDWVLKQGYESWSVENVNTPATRQLMHEYVDAKPDRVAWTVVDAYDHGAPTNRLRLICGPPPLIRALREMPVRRLSVAQAFAAAGVELPAPFIKNSTRTRHGRACLRSVQGPAHTQTASHPLMWARGDGSTVRCLTVSETAIVQSFPPHWMLPVSSRRAIRALGNAVCPVVGEAIMRAAMAARERTEQ